MTYPEQVPNALIQARCKDAVDVKKQPVAILDAQLLSQEIQHHAELGERADFEDALFQDGCRPDRLESHRYYSQFVLAC